MNKVIELQETIELMQSHITILESQLALPETAPSLARALPPMVMPPMKPMMMKRQPSAQTTERARVDESTQGLDNHAQTVESARVAAEELAKQTQQQPAQLKDNPAQMEESARVAADELAKQMQQQPAQLMECARVAVGHGERARVALGHEEKLETVTPVETWADLFLPTGASRKRPNRRKQKKVPTKASIKTDDFCRDTDFLPSTHQIQH